MADHSNVVALPGSRSSQSVIRSSKYEEKRRKLDMIERGVLCLIEQSLYEQLDAGQAECVRGLLPHEDGYHKCNAGVIWYYYSRTRRRYVLLDFEFNPLGGGQTQYDDRISSHTTCGELFSRVAKGGRLTALLSQMCLGLLGRVQLSKILLCGLKHNETLSKGGLFLFRKKATVNEIDVVLIRSALNASVRFSISAHFNDDDIPSWSVMRSIFDAPKQLEGSYARSMLAGEMICRLASLESSGGFPDANSDRRELIDDMYPNIRNRWSDRDLFVESQALIQGVSLGRRALLDHHSRYFSTCSITNNDFIEDDRCLNLLKSEMTLFLAYAVNMRARKSYTYLRVRETAPASKAILHKFALLCQFVKLSKFLFRNGSSGLAETDCTYFSRCTNADPGKLKLKFIPVISDFGLSTSIIAESMIKFDRYIDDPGDMKAVADRMIRLAGSILDADHENSEPN